MRIVDFVEALALSVGLQALPCQWPVAAGVHRICVPNLDSVYMDELCGWAKAGRVPSFEVWERGSAAFCV